MKMTIIQGDALKALSALPSSSIDLCITSPPYWGLRDYGIEGQLGAEPSMEAYIDNLLSWVKEVERVLKPSGSFVLNLAGCYLGGGRAGSTHADLVAGTEFEKVNGCQQKGKSISGLGGFYKAKQFLDVAAFAYTRIISETDLVCRNRGVWCKPNVPSPIRSRLKQSWEAVDWFVKDADEYYFDAKPWLKEITDNSIKRSQRAVITTRPQGAFAGQEWSDTSCFVRKHANARKEGRELNYPADKNTIEHAWRVIPCGEKQQGFELHDREKQEHVAPFPTALIRPWVQSLCPPDGVVLDPFLGSGTTMRVALEEGRSCVGIELNPAYVEYTKKRVNWSNGGLGNIHWVAVAE